MDELLKVMEDYAIQRQVPVVSPEAAVLLAATVSARRPHAVLEIGTAIGYSTLIIAGHTPPSARVTTIEIDPAWAEVAADFIDQSGLTERIDLRVGDAADIVPTLSATYDLVFLDAAKGQYLNHLLAIMDKLAPGAVIIADNVFFHGWVRGGRPPRRLRTMIQRLKDYLSFVTTDPRFTTTVFPLGDGIAISRYQEEPALEKN